MCDAVQAKTHSECYRKFQKMRFAFFLEPKELIQKGENSAEKGSAIGRNDAILGDKFARTNVLTCKGTHTKRAINLVDL